MPYLQLDFDAIPMIEAAATALELDPDKLQGALTRLWMHCWRKRSQFIPRAQIPGIAKVSHRSLIAQLELFGFLEVLEDSIRIRGTSRYVRMLEGAKRGGEAKASRAAIKSSTSAALPPALGSEGAAGGQGRSEIRDPTNKDQKLLSTGVDHPPLLVLAPSPDRPSQLVRLWNETAAPEMPRCRGLIGKRGKKAEKLLELLPLSEWPKLIANANASDFCRGLTDRGDWKLSLASMLERPELALKVLEGNYANTQGRSKPGYQEVARPGDHVQASGWEELDRKIAEQKGGSK